eukprot:2745507-Alexandrium_andersonii.AAC.1
MRRPGIWRLRYARELSSMSAACVCIGWLLRVLCGVTCMLIGRAFFHRPRALSATMERDQSCI